MKSMDLEREGNKRVSDVEREWIECGCSGEDSKSYRRGIIGIS